MNKKTSVIVISMVVLAVLFIVAVNVYKGPGTLTDDFPAAQYIKNPKSFSGNSYALKAQIDSQLAYDEASGRIILVKANDASPLPLYVPNSLSNFNPMVGQRYKFSIKVGMDSMLTVVNFQKL